jgi:hypothetical protein
MRFKTITINDPTPGDKKMKYSQQAQEENLSKVRRLMATHPGASVRDLQYLLTCHEIKLDKDYINKLKNKVIKERKYILDRETVKTVMADLKDIKDETVRQMADIAFSPVSKRPERIRAMAVMMERFKYTNAFETSGKLGFVMEYLKIQFGEKIKMVFNNDVLTILPKVKATREDDKTSERPDIQQT